MGKKKVVCMKNKVKICQIITSLLLDTI